MDTTPKIVTATPASSMSNLRSIALPVEHGGWAFWLEPVLLGWLLAFSVAGFWLAVSALAILLIHQPLKLTVKDHYKGRRYLRTTWAECFVIAYGLLALAAFVLAWLASPHVFWPPLVVAVPFAVAQLYFEAFNRGREQLPEVLGASALLAVGPSIAMAAGWDLSSALMLWLILGLRTLTSILYIRARLRLEKGAPFARGWVIVMHLVSVTILWILAQARLLPIFVVIPMLVLLARAVYGLSSHRKPAKPKIIGFQEMAYGLFFVLAVAILL